MIPTSAKKVLLISYYFAPQNTIGAVRPTKLAKYLTRLGCDVTVLCGMGLNAENDPTLERDLAELCDVRIIREWNPIRDRKTRSAMAGRPAQPSSAPANPTSVKTATSARSASGIIPRRFLPRMLDVVYRWLRHLSDLSFQRHAIREIYQMKKKGEVYDAVFSSYSPLSVHEAALCAKRLGVARRWIADFRDEPGVAFRWQKPYLNRLMRRVRENADLLSSVSEGALQMIGLPGRVLYNGFDRDDMPMGAPEPREAEEKLRLVYCGQFHSWRENAPERDLTPCFRALRALVDKGALDMRGLRVVYAGGEGGVMRGFAAACGLEDCVRDMGRVSRARSLALQQSADALLLAAWNAPGQTGILTGKLYEYMMMEKPIVACVAGNCPNSELKAILDVSGTGCCWEEASDDEDAGKLEAYLLELLRRKRAGLSLLSPECREKTARFDYANLAAELAAWMEQGSDIN